MGIIVSFRRDYYSIRPTRSVPVCYNGDTTIKIMFFLNIHTLPSEDEQLSS